MDTLLSRDYLGPIPHMAIIDVVGPEKKSGTIKYFGGVEMADLALAAMFVITAIIVALVIINWPGSAK